jgi:hypothetical protein
MGDFFPGCARRNSQDGGEALVDSPVKRFFAPAFDFPLLLSR